MKPINTDKFGRVLRDLRISVTDRCNFRCSYCMPAEIFGERYKFLPQSELLTFEEIARLTRILVGLGVFKVRITGGEPLIRRDLTTLVSLISDIDNVKDLTMTTNGYLLSDYAHILKDAGLHRVTVSLDSLDDQVFMAMNGRQLSKDRVLHGIKSAEDAGLLPIKINAVVRRSVNDHTIVDLAKYCKDHGYIVRFIEYMDVGTRNGWQLDEVVSAEEIVRTIDHEMPLERVKSNYNGEVAMRYRYVDGSGEMGVIASVTKPFCGDCTRLRLTPDGRIHTCLFSNVGTDIRRPIRGGATDQELLDLVTGIWQVRRDRYSEERSDLTEPINDKVEMYQIGG